MSRARNAGLLSFGQGVSLCVGIGIAAVLSRLFDQEDYATYRQTLLAYQMVAPLLILGLPSALYYFLPVERDRARGIVVENMGALLAFGVAFALFIILGGNVLLAKWFNNPSIATTLLWYAPFPLFALPVAAAGAGLVAVGKPEWCAAYTVASRLLLFGVIILCVALSTNPTSAIIGHLLGGIIGFAMAIFLMVKATSGTSGRATKRGARRQLAYAIPLGLGTTVAGINMQVDKVVVAGFVDKVEFAIYVNGATEIPIFAVVTGAITAVIIGDIRKFADADNFSAAVGLWKMAARRTSLILLPLGVVLFVSRYDLMELLFGSDYRSSGDVFAIYLLLIPARVFDGQSLIMARGRTRLILFRSLIGLSINLALTLVLVRFYGAKGAAIATVLMIWIWSLPFSLIVSAKLFNFRTLGLLGIRTYWLSLGACVAVVGMMEWLMRVVLLPHNLFYRIALVSGASVMLAFGLMLLVGATNLSEIRVILRSVVNKGKR